jgi:hypothetical protein
LQAAQFLMRTLVFKVVSDILIVQLAWLQSKVPVVVLILTLLDVLIELLRNDINRPKHLVDEHCCHLHDA